MARSGKNATFSDINITPLTDVFLVLLVVIIIAAPVTNQQREIKAPTMNSQPSTPIMESWPVIEIKSSGEIFSDGKPIQENELTTYLITVLPVEGSKSLVIRGDKAAQSGKVMEVMKAAGEAGFADVFISGELERNADKPAGT